jgi:pectate lyase
MGNYAMYGLNMLGSDSVILYNDEILKFYAFVSNSNDAIYVNKDGHNIIIDPYDKTLLITRMINKNDMTQFVEC